PGRRRSEPGDHRGRRLLQARQRVGHPGGPGDPGSSGQGTGRRRGSDPDPRPHRQPTDSYRAFSVQLAPLEGPGRVRDAPSGSRGPGEPDERGGAGRFRAVGDERDGRREGAEPARRTHCLRRRRLAMKRLFTLVFSRGTLYLLGMLALAGIVWFGGPLLSFAGWFRLESEMARWLLIALLAVLAIGRRLVRALAARRHNARMV